MSSISSLLVTLFFLLPILTTAADSTSKSYDLDGIKLDSSSPCTTASGARHSGCCQSSDVCLDGGLCVATEGKFVGRIWQNGCTKPTGKDEASSRLCPTLGDNLEGHDGVPRWNIQTCDYESYCCGLATDKGSCCSKLAARKFTATPPGAFQFPTPTSIVSMTATASSAPNTFPTAATVTAETRSPAMSTLEPICAKDKSLLVGVAVGGTLGLALVGLLAVLLWMYKRERRQRRLKEHYEAQFSTFNTCWALRKKLAACSTADGSSDVSTPSEKEVKFCMGEKEAEFGISVKEAEFCASEKEAGCGWR